MRRTLTDHWIAEAFDESEDVVIGLGPSEEFGIGVVSVDERHDVSPEGDDAAIDAATRRWFSPCRGTARVAFSGQLSNVLTIEAPMRASSTARGAPEAARKAAVHARPVRRRYLPTMARSRLSLAANLLVLIIFLAGQHNRTVRARACAVFGRIERTQFGTLFIAQCQRGKSLDSHQILDRCSRFSGCESTAQFMNANLWFGSIQP